MALRQKTVEALAELVTDDDVPEVLVDAEVNERLHDLQHRLEAQKLGLAEYFQATGHVARRAPGRACGSTPTGPSRRTWPSGPWSRPRSSTLSDEELDAEMATMAERMETTPTELRRQLDTAGRTGAVRSELRKAKALQWLLDHVELVDEEGNPMSGTTSRSMPAKEERATSRAR